MLAGIDVIPHLCPMGQHSLSVFFKLQMLRMAHALATIASAIQWKFYFQPYVSCISASKTHFCTAEANCAHELLKPQHLSAPISSCMVPVAWSLVTWMPEDNIGTISKATHLEIGTKIGRPIVVESKPQCFWGALHNGPSSSPSFSLPSHTRPSTVPWHGQSMIDFRHYQYKNKAGKIALQLSKCDNQYAFCHKHILYSLYHINAYKYIFSSVILCEVCIITN